MTMTATASWPALAELGSAGDSVYKAERALDFVSETLRQLADVRVAPSVLVPRPTLADIGALTWFVAEAELHVGILTDRLDEIRAVRDAVAYESVELDRIHADRLGAGDG